MKVVHILTEEREDDVRVLEGLSFYLKAMPDKELFVNFIAYESGYIELMDENRKFRMSIHVSDLSEELKIISLFQREVVPMKELKEAADEGLFEFFDILYIQPERKEL